MLSNVSYSDECWTENVFSDMPRDAFCEILMFLLLREAFIAVKVSLK